MLRTVRFVPTKGASSSTSPISQEVAVKIRDYFLSLPITGGERIFEAQLARDSGVNRPTIREACRILETEGLLIYTPNRGYSLKVLSPEEITSLIEFRLVLEEAAFVAATNSPNRLHICRRLREAYSLMLELDDDDDAARQISADLEFHRIALESMDNPWMVHSFDRMSTQLRYLIRLMSRSLADFKLSRKSHKVLIDCCQRGDVGRMRLEIRKHIYSFQRTLMKRLQSRSSRSNSTSGDRGS